MRNKILLWGCFSLVVLFSFWLTHLRSLSFHFVDEEDHIVGGQQINQGTILYKEISTNHTPLVYLGSQYWQKITQPDNMLMLIRRHRQGMWLYAAIWGAGMVYLWKWRGVAVFGLFEALKYFGFGNLWLMESMAVYPLMLAMMLCLDLFWFDKKLSNVTAVVLGVSLCVAGLNLLPLWPMIAVILVGLMIKQKQKLLVCLLAGLVTSGLMFLLISPIDWYREIVVNNWQYAIPALNTVEGTGDYLKLLFFPFRAFLDLSSFQAKIFGWLFAGFLLAAWKSSRFWLYLLLILANTRVLEIDAVFYKGFHLLPFTGVMIVGFVAGISLLWLQKKYVLVYGMIIVGLMLLANKNMPYFWKSKMVDEYYINYSQFEDLNWAIKQLASENDRLAIFTSESLIAWMAPAKLATRQLVYYAWQHSVPDLRENYLKVFKGGMPPEFIYGGNESNLTESSYWQFSKNDSLIPLFVRKDRYGLISDEQKEELRLRGFELTGILEASL